MALDWTTADDWQRRAWVAEHALGWLPFASVQASLPAGYLASPGTMWPPSWRRAQEGRLPPNYVGDWQAWRVIVDHMRAQGYAFGLKDTAVGKVRAQFKQPGNVGVAIMDSEGAAVCVAALRAVGQIVTA